MTTGTIARAFVIVYDTFVSEIRTMPERNRWEEKAANLLKAELKRRGVSYAQLVEKLAAVGITDSEANIKNKLSRGKFTAAFMLECLEAIGATTLHLSLSD